MHTAGVGLVMREFAGWYRVSSVTVARTHCCWSRDAPYGSGAVSGFEGAAAALRAPDLRLWGQIPDTGTAVRQSFSAGHVCCQWWRQWETHAGFSLSSLCQTSRQIFFLTADPAGLKRPQAHPRCTDNRHLLQLSQLWKVWSIKQIPQSISLIVALLFWLNMLLRLHTKVIWRQVWKIRWVSKLSKYVWGQKYRVIIKNKSISYIVHKINLKPFPKKSSATILNKDYLEGWYSFGHSLQCLCTRSPFLFA